VLLRGRWLAGHLLVLVMAGGFVALGVWQLARHHEKQDKVRAAKAAYAAPAPNIGPVTAAPAPGTRVQANGTYDGAHEILLRDQIRGNAIGNDVLTLLRLPDGSAVFVDRGWVASETAAPPPSRDVVVRGIIRESRPLGPQDEVRQIGSRVSTPRVDLDRLVRADRVDVPLHHIWIEARFQEPRPAANAPTLPTPPPPDHVNHLEYAIEWFGLAAIPLVGWPIVLWRVRRSPRPADVAEGHR
jgi:cytochrome oxidase assembly protein ShyY1